MTLRNARCNDEDNNQQFTDINIFTEDSAHDDFLRFLEKV